MREERQRPGSQGLRTAQTFSWLAIVFGCHDFLKFKSPDPMVKQSAQRAGTWSLPRSMVTSSPTLSMVFGPTHACARNPASPVRVLLAASEPGHEIK